METKKESCGTPLQGYLAHNKKTPSGITRGPEAQGYCRVVRGGGFL